MTVNQSSDTRDFYMDFLKGIAIISVVVGHSLSGVRNMDMLFNLIYSFHMPLLFFVSAYIEEQNKTKYTGKEDWMLYRRMGGLLLPYVSWTIICAVVSGQMQGLVLSLFGYGNNGLWFFPVLFGLKVMHALYWFLRNKMKKNTIVTDLLLLGGMETAVALIAVLTRHPYLVNMLSYAIPYFFAVLFVSHEAIRKLVNSEWMAAGAALVYALVFPYFSFYDTRWTTQVLRIGLSLCIIMICCKGNGHSGRWRANHIYSAMCVCGENSLAVYVLHGFLIDYKVYFGMIDSAFIVGILSVVLALFAAAVCIAAARIIGISAWWRKILFGK